MNTPQVNAKHSGTPAAHEIGRVDLTQPAPPAKQPGIESLELKAGGAHPIPLSPMDLQNLRTLGLFGPPPPLLVGMVTTPAANPLAHTYRDIPGLDGVAVRVEPPPSPTGTSRSPSRRTRATSPISTPVWRMASSVSNGY